MPAPFRQVDVTGLPPDLDTDMRVSASTAKTAVTPAATLAWGHSPRVPEVLMVDAWLDPLVLS